MKKSNKKYEINIESYGLYTQWDKKSRKLPEIQKFTNEIAAEPDNEFGMILRIIKGKGLKINFIISHPPFKNKDGNPCTDFIGEHIITSNNYLFFIGDYIWEPAEDKKGVWTIKVFVKNDLILTKRFIVQ